MQVEATPALPDAIAEPSRSQAAGLAPKLDSAYSRQSGIALNWSGETLSMVVREGTDPAPALRLQRQLGGPFTLNLLPPDRFRLSLEQEHGEQAALLSPISAEDADRLLLAILSDAAARGASDVHVEPSASGAVIALRIAGSLRPTLHLPVPVAEPLGRCIRARSGLPSGSDSPQRGRLDGVFVAGAVTADVSILPGVHGDRCVLRPHLATDRHAALVDLGMPRTMASALDPLLLRSGGVVIVAGPEGSGKRATLEALVRRLHQEARMVLSVGSAPEPVVEGLYHLQVSGALSIAAALRAVRDQDPDAIVVDQLTNRDSATAAFQAAQAGHVVLVPLASRDAVSAIASLRALKVEPFLLAAALGAVLAQRLVRRLCPECREPMQAHGSVSALLGFDPGSVVYAPRGCEACGDTGYSGRVAVFERIEADPAIRRLINDGGDEAILARHAFLNAPNLGSAARGLVRDGVTTAEEAIRVARSAVAPPIRC